MAPRLELTRNEWKRGDVLRGYDTVLYTNGSKAGICVGAGVFSETLDIRNTYRLPDNSIVFQAETLAIWKACGIIGEHGSSLGRIAIASDSQAAIQALGSSSVNSSVVRQCLDGLAVVGGRCFVTLIWVPRHRNIPGNEIADELARQGSGLDGASSENVRIPLNTLKRDVCLEFVSRANARWKWLSTCHKARMT